MDAVALDDHGFALRRCIGSRLLKSAKNFDVRKARHCRCLAEAPLLRQVDSRASIAAADPPLHALSGMGGVQPHLRAANGKGGKYDRLMLDATNLKAQIGYPIVGRRLDASIWPANSMAS